MFTDPDTATILNVVDGRRGKIVPAWLGARPRWWRRRVALVAIALSSEFRAAIRKAPPKVRISADHWHGIRLANETVTKLRRRYVWNCTSGEVATPTPPTGTEELAVAWGIKEHVRQLLAARDTADFQRQWAALEKARRTTRLAEPLAP